MESWAVFYLGATIMGTGACVGPSDGGTAVLAILSLVNFAIAIALKAL